MLNHTTILRDALALLRAGNPAAALACIDQYRGRGPHWSHLNYAAQLLALCARRANLGAEKKAMRLVRWA
jgi:hypothetical protein